MLGNFFNSNKRAAPTFIVFRHGITEEQVQMVVDEEIPAIREGCSEWVNGYK